MIRTKILLSLILVSYQLVSAISLKEALIDVNEQWAYRPADLQLVSEDYCSYTPNEIIRKHLFLVHEILSQKDVSHLSDQQLINRQSSLEHLLSYAERGVFPTNLTHTGRRPIFIDHLGVHCAVGYLITQSGHEDLSLRISANMNPFYIKDMQDDQLSEWVAESGFTLEELAWIQPGYPFPVDWNDMDGGANKPVFAIGPDGLGGILAGGFFDTVGGYRLPYLANWYIGFAGYDWKGFTNGTGPNGPVNAIIEHNGKIYMAGEFSAVDSTYTGSGVVMWDGSTWVGLGDFYIGALVNYVNTLTIHNDTLYAGGFFRSEAGAPEYFNNLAKWDGTQWVAAMDASSTPGFIQGEVHALHSFNGKLYVGGDFQLATGSYHENIFSINGNQLEFLNDEIPLPVYALETHHGELYAGCQYMNATNQDTAGLVVFRNNAWERVLDIGYQSNHAVYALENTPDGLVIGGEFVAPIIIGTTMKNIMAINMGGIYPLGILDSSVTSLYFQNDLLYIGGRFSSGFGMTGPEPLGHITNIYLPDYLSTAEQELPRFSVYPNPASNEITVNLQNVDQVDALEMIDMSGKVYPIKFERSGNQLKLDVSRLTKGAYILKIRSGEAILEETLMMGY